MKVICKTEIKQSLGNYEKIRTVNVCAHGIKFEEDQIYYNLEYYKSFIGLINEKKYI